MRAYNKNNMRNPKPKDVGRVTHVIVVAMPDLFRAHAPNFPVDGDREFTNNYLLLTV